jgi:hypothetical protein
VGAIERQAHLPVEQIFEQTLEEVRRFAAAGSFEDDVCLVGVEVAHLLGGAQPIGEPLSVSAGA